MQTVAVREQQQQQQYNELIARVGSCKPSTNSKLVLTVQITSEITLMDIRLHEPHTCSSTPCLLVLDSCMPNKILIALWARARVRVYNVL